MSKKKDEELTRIGKEVRRRLIRRKSPTSYQFIECLIGKN